MPGTFFNFDFTYINFLKEQSKKKKRFFYIKNVTSEIRGAIYMLLDILYRHLEYRTLLNIQYVIAMHLMRWLTNFIILDSNEQLQQQLEYTLLKPDCHS